ncbi:hypothetical protein WJX74_009979 [Apatococcus lobatus]|uniref:CSN8/PSMD8/EIF3K domain-containing protein n=2 Tax=Apatococcus TaxID=904362 RepID=A0AAW1SDD0_9CHLO
MDGQGLDHWQIALHREEWTQVAPHLDSLELELGRALSNNWPVDVHILGHIYNGDLADARFVWKRAPKAAQQVASNQAAFVLLQHLWNKEYQTRWHAINSQHWRPETVPLVIAVASKLRGQTLDLISGAYTSITVEKASTFLGCSADDTLKAARSQQWELAEDGATLKVTRPPPSQTERSSIKQLQHLSQYVLRLEA